MVLALSLSGAVAFAQTTGGPATSGTGGSTGSSATGGRSAPAAQPGSGTRNTESRKDDKLDRADRKFMEKAAEGGMFEVESGKLASTRATHANVKSFGETLVKDHSQANDELVKLANAKGVELPAGPSHGQRNDIAKLGKKSGAGFDKEFVSLEVKDHRKDVKEFEKASGKAKDPELKAWIDKTLPHLREHLASAENLQKGGDASAMGNRGASRPVGATGSKTGG
jgi:putative membrane protein